MAFSLDVIATEYRLIDNYSKKLSGIAASTDSFGKKLAGTLQAVQGFGLGALGVLGSGLVALGVSSLKAAADNEQLRVTLEALTGSAAKANAKLAFIRKLAIPATTGFKELAEAAVTLEAFGLRAEAILPTLAKLQAAFSQNPEALRVGARIFGELAGGQVPGIDQLGILGLNRPLLIKFGLKFDGQGKLLSSANEAIDAVKRVVESKYGGILDKMANTTNAKLATLGDKWESLKVKVGNALTKYAIPAISKLTETIDKIEKSEGFDKFLQRLGGNFIKFVLVVAESLTFFQLAIAALKFAVKDYAGALQGVAAAALIAFGSQGLARNAVKILKSLKIGGVGGGPLDKIPVDTGPNFEPGQGPAAEEKETTQKRIEANTRKTADSMSSFGSDLRRYVVGGGPLAQIGVTPSELGAFQNSAAGGGSGSGGIQVNVGNRKLSDAITEITEQVVLQVMKSKPWGHTRFAR